MLQRFVITPTLLDINVMLIFLFLDKPQGDIWEPVTPAGLVVNAATQKMGKV